jgi:mannose-1-phosphate guanylyltransferase
MKHAYAVILAGGKGERFWPLSTSRRPKQLLALLGGQTLISMAAERLEGLIPPERILIITSRDLVDVTRMAVPDLPANNVIGEPVGRDTAAACALACALVERRDPLGVFCILTADQVIGDVPLFQSTLREGFRTATENDVLITIG